MINQLKFNFNPSIKSIKLSDSIRAKYWSEKKDKDKLPKKYMNENFSFRTKGKGGKFLYDAANSRFVIKNSKKVGTPRFWVINFQDIYNARFGPEQRAVVVEKIKEAFTEEVKRVIESTTIELPIKSTMSLEINIYEPLSEQNVDLDNRAFLNIKCFQDLLKKLGVIEDDNCKYIRSVSVNYFESDVENRTEFILNIGV